MEGERKNDTNAGNVGKSLFISKPLNMTSSIETNRFRLNMDSLKALKDHESLQFRVGTSRTVRSSRNNTFVKNPIVIRVTKIVEADSRIILEVRNVDDSKLVSCNVKIYRHICPNYKTIKFSNENNVANVKIPYSELRRCAQKCGHVILRLDTVIKKGSFHELFRLKGTPPIPTPESCIRCDDNMSASFEFEPSHPKFIDLFHNEPFTRDIFANFGIRVENEEFFVHPVVIGYSSPVFLCYLTNTASDEAKQGFVVVNDAESKHMRILLEAIYDPIRIKDWEITFAFLAPLYVLGDRYDVATVTRACKDAFRVIPIDASNLCDVLGFADLYDLDDLMARCCSCSVQKDLPSNFWFVDTGKQLKSDDKRVFDKYSNILKNSCKCGPPRHRKRKHE